MNNQHQNQEAAQNRVSLEAAVEAEIQDTIHLIHGTTDRRLEALGVRLETERILRSFAGDHEGIEVMNRLLRAVNAEQDKRKRKHK